MRESVWRCRQVQMRGTIAHFGFGCGLLAIETSIRKLIELITEDDVVRYQMGPSQHEHAGVSFRARSRGNLAKASSLRVEHRT